MRAWDKRRGRSMREKGEVVGRGKEKSGVGGG